MTRELGQLAEALACDYLTRQGFRLIQKNYQTTCGEIDLIMRDQENLVFVEVRFRKSAQYGSPLESITRNKQRKIINTAYCYLNETNNHDQPCRFDVIVLESLNPPSFDWVPHAFIC